MWGDCSRDTAKRVETMSKQNIGTHGLRTAVVYSTHITRGSVLKFYRLIATFSFTCFKVNELYVAET